MNKQSLLETSQAIVITDMNKQSWTTRQNSSAQDMHDFATGLRQPISLQHKTKGMGGGGGGGMREDTFQALITESHAVLG